jgi:hypothetical protein
VRCNVDATQRTGSDRRRSRRGVGLPASSRLPSCLGNRCPPFDGRSDHTETPMLLSRARLTGWCAVLLSASRYVISETELSKHRCQLRVRTRSCALAKFRQLACAAAFSGRGKIPGPCGPAAEPPPRRGGNPRRVVQLHRSPTMQLGLQGSHSGGKGPLVSPAIFLGRGPAGGPGLDVVDLAVLGWNVAFSELENRSQGRPRWL